MRYINLHTEDDTQWRNSLKEYRRYLEGIQSRFPKKFFQFYTEVGMHDSVLTECKVTKRHLANKDCIDIQTRWNKSGKSFLLILKDVKGVMTNIDLSNGYSEFGDYIIGEFLAVDEELLSFEFAFYDIDNIVKITFKKLCYQLLKPDKA